MLIKQLTTIPRIRQKCYFVKFHGYKLLLRHFQETLSSTKRKTVRTRCAGNVRVHFNLKIKVMPRALSDDLRKKCVPVYIRIELSKKVFENPA